MESDAAELVATLNFTVTLRRLQVRSGPVGVMQSLAIFREMSPPPVCSGETPRSRGGVV